MVTHSVLNLTPGEIDRQSEELRSLIRRWVADENQVEDLVQESWTIALEEPPGRIRQFQQWIRSVARNRAMRFHRARISRTLHESRAARPERVDTDDPLTRHESLRDEMKALVRELPEPYRTVIQLRYLESIPYLEIALRLGRSEGTVRSQVRRGLRRLNERLGGKDRGELLPWITGLPSLVFGGWRRSDVVPLATCTGLAAAVAVTLVIVWQASGTPRADGDPLRVADGATPQDSGASPVDDPAVTGGQESGPRVSATNAVAPRAGTGAEASTPDGPFPTAAHASRVAGRVVLSRDARPFEGAEILVAPAERPDEARVVGASDGSGDFELIGLAPGSWVSARHPNGVTGPALRLGRVPSDVTLPLPRFHDSDLSGRVVGPGEAPVAGAELAIRFGEPLRALEGGAVWGPSPALRVVTDERGAFRFRPARGRMVAEIRAEGFASAARSLSLPHNASAPLRIALEPVDAAPALRGRVLGPGAASAILELETLGERSDLARLHGVAGGRRVRTDAEGSFLLPDLPRGEAILRLFTGGGDRPQAYRRFTVESDDLALELRTDELAAGAAVAGELDPTRGLDGIRIALDAPFLPRALPVPHGDGRFSLTDLVPGTYRLLVQRPGSPLEIHGPFELTAGTRELGFLRTPERGRLALAVNRAPELPAEPLRVRFQRGEHDRRADRLSVTEDLLTDELAAGLWTVRVWTAGQATPPWLAKVEPGTPLAAELPLLPAGLRTIELRAARPLQAGENLTVRLPDFGEAAGFQVRNDRRVDALRLEERLPKGTLELSVETSAGLRGRGRLEGERVVITLE